MKYFQFGPSVCPPSCCLEVGDYTASFTCDGGSYTPEGEEVLVFTGTQNVTVNTNQTTTIAIAPSS